MRVWISLIAALSCYPVHAQEMAPDRMVAEWAIRMGGNVVLEGQRKPIHDLAALPAANFRVHTLDLCGITLLAGALDDELRRLPPLPHLKELIINGRIWYGQPPSAIAEVLSIFAGDTEIEKLSLSRPVQTYIPFEDGVLKQLRPLTNLRELRLHDTKIPGATLVGFPHLKSLDLSYDRFFDDRGMPAFDSMHELTQLYLHGTSITDEGLKHLAGLTNLTELDLADVSISDQGLAYLAGLTKLRRLNLEGATVTDAGLGALRGMTGLEELSLYRTKVSNAGLLKLANLKQLKDLDLRYTRATGSGIAELVAGIPNCKVQFQDSGKPQPTRAVEAAAVRWQG